MKNPTPRRHGQAVLALRRHRRAMKIAGLALSASVFVAVGLTSVHGHAGGAEYPQRCSVCVSAGQASLHTPAAVVPVAVATVRIFLDVRVVLSVPFLDVFSPQLSRAPPA